MKLPKLYRTVKIKFWSLRTSIGDHMGVIPDCDQIIERRARRVRCTGGWKWQIVNAIRDSYWDWDIPIDQEILDEYGCETPVESIDL